jgi:hypothetical protein
MGSEYVKEVAVGGWGGGKGECDEGVGERCE